MWARLPSGSATVGRAKSMNSFLPAWCAWRIERFRHAAQAATLADNELMACQLADDDRGAQALTDGKSYH